MNRLVAQLRNALSRPPCSKHKKRCPVPPPSAGECSWGHDAVEFSDFCDDCALIVVRGLGRGLFAQRLHGLKSRSRNSKPKRGRGRK